MIFGKESDFAIELGDSSSNNLAPVRIWIGGMPIGTLEEETYLPSLVHQLTRIFDCPPLGDNEWHRLQGEGLDYILSEDCGANGRFLVSLGESFDDFVVARYQAEKGIVFLIQAAESPFFTYNKFTPGERYQSVVDESLVHSAVLKLKSCMKL
jgi:hypothetical protein